MSLIPGLLPRQKNCVDCSGVPAPVCNCDAGFECQKINKDCNTCSSIKCVPIADASSSSSLSSSSGAVSKGALAGAIVGVVVFLAIAVGILFWYRRSPRFARHRQSGTADKPAPAADVLNRPDPIEKALASPVDQPPQERQPTSPPSVPHVDHDTEAQPNSSPHRPISTQSNPFSDGHSIQTAGTESTNVIPIALVTPEAPNSAGLAPPPIRPSRSPELHLNLDHVNVSHDNLKRAGVGSLRSGVSGVSRNSYMSGASYSSDLLNEAPMIITPTVRHVVGTVKAEMVDARSPRTPGSPMSDGLRTPGTASRPIVGSPLAQAAFKAADASRDSTGSSQNPFDDQHASIKATNGDTSPSASVTTFGQSVRQPSPSDKGTLDRNVDSRPSSMSTQAGSVIDIGSATRVNFSTASGTSLYKTMVGRLVSPSSVGGFVTTPTTPDAQQTSPARESSEFIGSRRTSAVSAVSATADSILEAFPFVPPSPISSRPLRTPPASPLTQQMFTVTPASPAPFEQTAAKTEELPAPDRRMLGMSTGSQLSTASSGLGSFPFQIEDGGNSRPPSAFHGPRQRASLDTLAITSDLSSYPLEVDKPKNPLRKD